jgi:hypothetical protein
MVVRLAALSGKWAPEPAWITVLTTSSTIPDFFAIGVSRRSYRKSQRLGGRECRQDPGRWAKSELLNRLKSYRSLYARSRETIKRAAGARRYRLVSVSIVFLTILLSASNYPGTGYHCEYRCSRYYPDN